MDENCVIGSREKKQHFYGMFYLSFWYKFQYESYYVCFMLSENLFLAFLWTEKVTQKYNKRIGIVQSECHRPLLSSCLGFDNNYII